MTILRGSNCTCLDAITYIKRWKSLSKGSVASQAREGGTTTMGTILEMSGTNSDPGPGPGHWDWDLD
ncbi:unnamed protein product [Adineta steineri]|uniref:Uncharacterized protein n=1 Tax=Adineta steineri TaxID=433720 RepID=A0A820KXW5_9BILA|nr:unnamed protein product [Adineta steineri]